MAPEDLATARRALMAWYRPRRRGYPWRVRPSPYKVLVSEVMLQQTQAPRVAPIFERFVARFPTIGGLARASRAEVLRAWAGLGYNRRAVALSEAARAMERRHGGRVPRRLDDLMRLPGVGPYTAAAVASVAFAEPVAAVDTNARRVVSRAVLGVPEGAARDEDVRNAAEDWLDRADPGGFNQALMDLGREVCRPLPRCSGCPLSGGCRFIRRGPPPRADVVTHGRRSRQQAFEGSSRQVRGRVVDALRRRPSATLDALARSTGVPLPRVSAAVAGLAREGLVTAGRAALAGRPRGMVRLPS